MPGPAATLMIEEELQKIIKKTMPGQAGRVGWKFEKSQGLLPQGEHSVFGNYPSDYMPYTLKHKLAMSKKAKSLPRIGSAPTLGTPGSKSPMSASMSSSDFFKKSGFSWNPHLPPDSPPRAGAVIRRPVAHTQFRTFYDRGDLPISVMHGSVGGKITWKVDIKSLDYAHYLPIFFDGLREKEDPYRFLAVTGAYDLMENGGSKLLPVVPQLIIPVKTALNTRDPEIVCTQLKILQKLVLSGDMIGEALVPYYRQLLPIFNLFKNAHLNIGDGIDYAQRKRLNLGQLIDETLEIFEINGGEDAFINIKYMIPVYESCIKA